MLHIAKRLLVGRAKRSQQLHETLLPKSIALPVFCSDPLSSVAYATDEILLVLTIGGVAFLGMAPWIAIAISLLLIVVVASYRQACYAYPNGGGAYVVSRANLGTNASLVAASALMVDYVLTVAVSVVAGVANIVSAFPRLGPHAVVISIAVVGFVALMNLRGTKESGALFAVPTYGFVAIVMLMVVWGLGLLATGHHLHAESARFHVAAASGGIAGIGTIWLALRAFSSGSTALTGVEAISNGVPSFRPPKSRNAAVTLSTMAVMAVTMFGGITALALISHVHMTADSSQLIGAPSGYVQKTVIAQLGHVVFGTSLLFYLLQAFTAGILILAANTAFNGFPILASILSKDGFMPQQFARRGDRLVFSNGVVVLTLSAVLLIWAFNASTTRLIQLYVIGVFVSFTLSQAGLVRHWTRLLNAGITDPPPARMRRARAINMVGALFTGVVLVVVLATKFVHGAWIVVIAMPVLFLVMRGVHRHYASLTAELAPEGEVTLPSRVHVIVLVSRLHAPTLQAVSFARAMHPATLTALTVSTNNDETTQLLRDWAAHGIPVELTVLDSPYRDITGPVLDYVRSVRRKGPRDVVCVIIPEYVVGHWWEHLLHNQSALRLKARLLFEPGVMVTSVPWQLRSTGQTQIAQPPARESAGV